MSDEIDILMIDNKIRNNFMIKINHLCDLKEKLEEINKILENNNLKSKIKDNFLTEKNKLELIIKDLEIQYSFNFYIINVVNLIEEYKNILLTPIKTSFLGKEKKNNKRKKEIIKKYIEIATEYIDFHKDKLYNIDSKILQIDLNSNFSLLCDNCGNKKNFELMDNNIYTCLKCYAQQTVLKYTSSYNDIDRVNLSSKYTYDRKVHFRDCIKQYQGRQNSTIPDKIFKELEDEFESHHLLIGNKNDNKEIRFSQITKNHILMFLKELGYSNHYENVHLIHYIFTNIKPNDISHLEEQLLDDFDILTDLYDKMFKDIDRKNFINTQYVLFQLLRRHKYPCKKEEFIILKTIDRIFFHDQICKILFEYLGWNHIPFY